MSTNKIEVETKTFIRFWLVLLGIVAVGFLIWKAKTGLLILGAALFLAIAISPLVNKLAEIIPGESKKIPIALAYLIVVGAIATFVAVVVPAILTESIKFVTNLPAVLDSANLNSGMINEFGQRFGIEDLRTQIVTTIGNFSGDFVKNIGSHITASVSALTNGFTAFILIVVLGMFMLIEGPELFSQFWSNFRSNPKAIQGKRVLSRMCDVISKYVSGNLIVALINACATAIAVFVLALIFGFSPGLAFPFGLITGVLGIIPMFGSAIGTVIVSILLAFNSFPAGIAFAIYDTIYLQVESNYISPKIQAKGLQLPALVVLISVTIGVYMFGLVGAIIATPIAGCIKIILEEYGDGFLPTEQKKRKRRILSLKRPSKS